MCVYTSTLSKQVTTCSRWIEEGKERKKKETHVPLDGGYFPSQQEAGVHPDTNGLVPLFKQKVFLKAAGNQRARILNKCFLLVKAGGTLLGMWSPGLTILEMQLSGWTECVC